MFKDDKPNGRLAEFVVLVQRGRGEEAKATEEKERTGIPPVLESKKARLRLFSDNFRSQMRFIGRIGLKQEADNSCR